MTGRTKAILPVDLAGQPADLDPLLALGLPVVEDAAHAVESALPRPADRLDRARDVLLPLRDEERGRGRGRRDLDDDDDVADEVREPPPDAPGPRLALRHRVPGYKANLSDVLAAIALVQLDKVERHARDPPAPRSRLYDEAVADLDGITPLARDPRDTHALHLYVVRIDPERAGGDRDEYQRLSPRRTSATSIHFLPVHQLTVYRDAPARPGSAPGRRARRRRDPLAPAFPGALRRGHRRRRRRAEPCARLVEPMSRRSIRVALTLLVTGLCTAYLIWKIDLGRTLRVIGERTRGTCCSRSS